MTLSSIDFELDVGSQIVVKRFISGTEISVVSSTSISESSLIYDDDDEFSFSGSMKIGAKSSISMTMPRFHIPLSPIIKFHPRIEFEARRCLCTHYRSNEYLQVDRLT